MDAAERIGKALPHAARAGVHNLPSEGIEVLAQAARAAGYAFLPADLADCTDKAGFLAGIAQALHFPAWFGQNWDALADCLNDFSWLPADGYVIVLDHADRFRLGAAADFLTALEIFEEAAQAWAAEGVPLWTFVGLTSNGITRLRSL